MRLPTLAALAVLLYGTAARADQISWPYNRVSVPTTISAHAVPSADTAAPDHFTKKTHSLNLTLTEAASGAKGTLPYAGMLNATMSAQAGGGVSAGISFADKTTRKISQGINASTVALDGSMPPTLNNPGGFGDQITPACVLGGGPPPTQPPPSTNNPEPSAFVLACLGVSLAILSSRRKPRGAVGSKVGRE